MSDAVVSILIILGGGFAAVAGLGLLRLPDVLIRMHASTKAGTLGVGLIVLGVSVHFASSLVLTKAILIIVFLFLTAPVGAHLIARAAYRRGIKLWERTLMDDGAMKHSFSEASNSENSIAEKPASEKISGSDLDQTSDK